MAQENASKKPSEGAHRQASFDPVRIGQRECDAWAAYYRHEWASFLRSAIGMVSAGFGMGRRQTLTGAWYVLQANRAWAPVPDNNPDAARDYMARFYALVRDSGWGSLDPVTAAGYEVEWWRLHRLHQREGADAEALLAALDVLYSYVYDVPLSTMREAARLRVEAMDLSDRWVEAGCDLADPLLSQERRALVASYTALRDSVERHQRQSVDLRGD
ncbi:MAG TPA: hypothetical protein VK662_01585 [Acidothermaceae bacterium]|nr:hypothetical protein [Acidothermaceae bacterium]